MTQSEQIRRETGVLPKSAWSAVPSKASLPRWLAKGKRREAPCKPDSGPRRVTAISLGSTSQSTSNDLPGRCSARVIAIPFPIWSFSEWGLPCRPCHHARGALLPHRFTLTDVPKHAGGLFSVALSLSSRSVAVDNHSDPWSPDFPPRLSCVAGRSERPSRRLTSRARYQNRYSPVR